MLESQRHLFDLNDNVTYLNCAYMSPLMRSVEEAGSAGLKAKKHPWKVSVDDFFEPTEELRSEAAKLLNISEPSRIVTIPSVSYGMAQVASNLSTQAGDEILTLKDQFPSSVYAWDRFVAGKNARLVTVPPPEDWDQRGSKWNMAVLESINERTCMVVIEQIHWTDGTLFDLEAIRKKCDQYQALMVVDATQSLGAIPFDMQKIKADAVIAAGYKSLMGPYSIGIAYFGPVFDSGRPIEENWINRKNSQNFGDLVNYKKDYQPGALRYEVGEHSNFILVPMMLEALRVVNSWGSHRVKEYCDRLVEGPIKKLKEAGYHIDDHTHRASNLFGIHTPTGVSTQSIHDKLKKNHIHVSVRGKVIRVSPNVYNTDEDMEKLVSVLS